MRAPGRTSEPGSLDATVLICTFNRAAHLAPTLESLSRTRADRPWEILVVDNNSSDATPGVVAAAARRAPAPVRYLFEPRQGKSNALNTGLASAAGRAIVFTDDDVRVAESWLEAACRPLLDGTGVDYTGGPVRPIWGAPRPDWLSAERGELWGTIAIADYGPEPFVFEDRRKIPLGVNMAVRRNLIDRIGGFHPELGRTGRSLLGQEQAEFFCRSRAVGARGLYVPAMEVHHYVPAERLTKRYFRRWWFWKGISRARLAAMHTVTELGLDLAHVPHVFGVPRFMFGTALRDARAWALACLRGDARQRFVHEMMLCYFAGYLRGARRGSLSGTPLPISGTGRVDDRAGRPPIAGTPGP